MEQHGVRGKAEGVLPLQEFRPAGPKLVKTGHKFKNPFLIGLPSGEAVERSETDEGQIKSIAAAKSLFLLPEHDLALFQSRGQVYEPLVAAATEEKGQVSLRLNKLPVH